jgi:hypothetical protein
MRLIDVIGKQSLEVASAVDVLMGVVTEVTESLDGKVTNASMLRKAVPAILRECPDEAALLAAVKADQTVEEYEASATAPQRNKDVFAILNDGDFQAFFV